MDAIGVRNLRSLADTGAVTLRPLTLLLGRNSSGKSTFLRTFPLLRQSVEARTAGPILWYGQFVDFGDFNDALRSGAELPTITLEFEFPLALRSYLVGELRDRYDPLGARRARHLLTKRDVKVSVDLMYNEQSGITAVSACEFSLGGNDVSLRLDERGRVHRLTVNDLDVLKLNTRFVAARTGAVLPFIEEHAGNSVPAHALDDYVDRNMSDYRPRTLRSRVWETLFKEIRSLFTQSTSAERIERTLNHLLIGSDTDMLDSMQNSAAGTSTWERNVAGLTTDAPKFKRIRDLSFAFVLPGLLRAADYYLASYFRNVTYSKPLRAVTERYYRPQNLAVEEVDPEGTNLPMFLSNLSPREKQSFQEWTERHLGFRASAESAGGHISLKVKEQASDREHNLTDMGFGLSQVLPIMAQIWSLTQGPRRRLRGLRVATPLTFVIEQPELHLHPGLQAKVVDLFLESIEAARQFDVELRLVVETHSETMINRIGQKISEDGVDPSDVQIVLFEQSRQECSEVRLVDYNDEGFLMDWPFGFFEPEMV